MSELRDKFLKKTKRLIKVADVVGIGEVGFRNLSQAEAMSFQDIESDDTDSEIVARIAIAVIVDPVTQEKIFTDSDIDVIKELDAATAVSLVTVLKDCGYFDDPSKKNSVQYDTLPTA